MARKNLALPGNPRYQPKELKKIFGYDNLCGAIAEVEIATLQTLGEIGVIPKEDILLLDDEAIKNLLSIKTSDVDRLEREKTKHYIRAWVQIAKERVHPRLRKWIHIPLTSSDVLDTANTIRFVRAYNKVIRPKLIKLIKLFCVKITSFSDVIQIGRTHGQHAIPITVGFWWATILDRIISNFDKLNQSANELAGIISGAVGADNAGLAIGLPDDFESRVLARLGLKPSRISTQINPPENFSYFLFSAMSLSATLGQFARDCRHLMRSEIGEVFEPFDTEQVGSSTMAHKRNPFTFENIEGMWLRNKNEFGKVLDSLISEHQRDLVGSSVSRDFPIIIINLVNQLNSLCTVGKNGNSFIERINVDEEACLRNFEMGSKMTIAEPLYIVLQMAGYTGDAHHFVNHKLVPLLPSSESLLDALFCSGDKEAISCIENIPKYILDILLDPKKYTGDSVKKSHEIVLFAKKFLKRIS